MMFREIIFGSEEYQRERSLRDDILRAPLGLSLPEADLDREKEHLHFGLFEPDGTLVACAVAVPLSASKVRIRQMAVRSSRQRKGLGTQIMNEIERTLKARGFSYFVLNARVSAVGFYEKLGYSVMSGEFVEVTIPHVRMDKVIQNS